MTTSNEFRIGCRPTHGPKGWIPRPPQAFRMLMLLGLALVWSLVDLHGPRSLSAQDAELDFAHDVMPILKRHCAECHTAGTYRGAFSLDSRADLLESGVTEGDVDTPCELIERVTSTDPDYRMPPEGPRLTGEEVAVLQRWLASGLSWPEELAFRKKKSATPLALRTVSPPGDAERTPHPIDRFLEPYFADRELTPPERMPDAVFLRRLKLDLLGLLPTPDAVQRFAQDPSAEKDQRMADELLDQNHEYAKHWLTFWNDLLRNDYVGTGYIDGGRTQISGWLYASLVENKPYDQMVRELIDPQPEAAGFIRGIKWRGRVNASQIEPLQFSQNISQVFLGINMKCASCHDSFIDDWKLNDAYGLAAVITDEPLEIHECDQPTGQIASPGFVFPELGSIDGSATRETRLKQLAALMTTPENGRFARTIVNRLWQRLFGRGLVHPVDIMENEPWHPELLDYLAADLVAHEYDLKHTLKLLVTSDIYRRYSLSQSENEIASQDFQFLGVQTRRMTAEQFVDAIASLSGVTPTAIHGSLPGQFPDPEQVPQGPVRASLIESDLLMRSLGRPNREQVVTTRPEQLSTLQALDLTNGPEMSETLSRAATAIAARFADADPSAVVENLFIEALMRPPTDGERETALSFFTDGVTQEAYEDFLWTLLVLPEFQLIR